MKKVIIASLLALSLTSAAAQAGPSSRGDKVITGLIVGATAAAIVAAIAHADEVKVDQKPPKHYREPVKTKPHYQPRKHWRNRDWHHRDRIDWRKRHYNDRNYSDRHYDDRRWRH
ncbi:MAG: hypothetical protein HWE12_02425 [Oceanospirillaceae bacterium]|nr:hypothetical protein [Oceanospirillaceae bacterium]